MGEIDSEGTSGLPTIRTCWVSLGECDWRTGFRAWGAQAPRAFFLCGQPPKGQGTPGPDCPSWLLSVECELKTGSPLCCTGQCDLQSSKTVSTAALSYPLPTIWLPAGGVLPWARTALRRNHRASSAISAACVVTQAMFQTDHRALWFRPPLVAGRQCGIRASGLGGRRGNASNLWGLGGCAKAQTCRGSGGPGWRLISPAPGHHLLKGTDDRAEHWHICRHVVPRITPAKMCPKEHEASTSRFNRRPWWCGRLATQLGGVTQAPVPEGDAVRSPSRCTTQGGCAAEVRAPRCEAVDEGSPSAVAGQPAGGPEVVAPSSQTAGVHSIHSRG